MFETGIGRSLWLGRLGRKGEHRAEQKLKDRWEVTAPAQVRMEMERRISQEAAAGAELRPALKRLAYLNLLSSLYGLPSLEYPTCF